MPLYHAAGLYLFLMMVHYWELPCAFGIADRSLSSDILMEALRYSGADSVILPPAILEGLSQTDEAVEVLKDLSWVIFAGDTFAPTPSVNFKR